MKRIAALFLALCLLCFSGCVKTVETAPPKTENSQDPTENTAEDKVKDDEQQEIEEQLPELPDASTIQWPEEAPYLSVYYQAIRDYRALVDLRLSPSWDPEKSMPALPGGMENSLLIPIHELPVYGHSQLSDYGYILYDLNSDEVPELFWARADRSIVAVFTCYQGQLKLLDAYWSRYRGCLKMPGQLWTYSSGGAADNIQSCYVLQNGSLEEVYRFAMESAPSSAQSVHYYEKTPQSANQLEITQSRYEELSEELRQQNDLDECSFYTLDHVPTKEDGSFEKDPNINYLPYLQRVSRSDQPIYAGPGYDYSYCGTVEVAAIYTMTAEVNDKDGHLWGRLKSGVGWIDLTNVRNQAYLSAAIADSALLAEGNYHYLDADGPDYSKTVVIRTTGPITDLKIYRGDWSSGYDIWTCFYTLDQLTPEKPLVVRISLPHDFSFYGFSYVDGNGKAHYYRVYDDLSGEKPIGFTKLSSAPYIAQ